MPLLNYSTTVPVSRTIAQVTETLAKSGARQVLTDYSASGLPIGIAFAVETPTGLQQYHLPVDVVAITQVMKNDRGIPPRLRTPEQAERVGWRITKDWLEAQLAIIATRMVTFDQVMLPYMSAGGGRTVYDLYLSQQLALPAGTTDDDDVLDGEVIEAPTSGRSPS